MTGQWIQFHLKHIRILRIVFKQRESHATMSEEKSNLPDNVEQADDAEPPPYSYPSQSFS